jgi:hypothetical protein
LTNEGGKICDDYLNRNLGKFDLWLIKYLFSFNDFLIITNLLFKLLLGILIIRFILNPSRR